MQVRPLPAAPMALSFNGRMLRSQRSRSGSIPLRATKFIVAMSSSGRTLAFQAKNAGSNPADATKFFTVCGRMDKAAVS